MEDNYTRAQVIEFSMCINLGAGAGGNTGDRLWQNRIRRNVVAYGGRSAETRYIVSPTFPTAHIASNQSTYKID